MLGNVRIGFVTEKSNIFENKIVVSSLKIWDRESMAGRVFGWRAILVRSMTDFRTIMFCGIGLDIWPLSSSVKHIIFLEELLIYVERLESYVSLTVFFFIFLLLYIESLVLLSSCKFLSSSQYNSSFIQKNGGDWGEICIVE